MEQTSENLFSWPCFLPEQCWAVGVLTMLYPRGLAAGGGLGVRCALLFLCASCKLGEGQVAAVQAQWSPASVFVVKHIAFYTCLLKTFLEPLLRLGVSCVSPGCFLGASWMPFGRLLSGSGCSWLPPGCFWVLPGCSWVLLVTPGCILDPPSLVIGRRWLQTGRNRNRSFNKNVVTKWALQQLQLFTQMEPRGWQN